jgi:Alpha-2-macroglobulin family
MKSAKLIVGVLFVVACKGRDAAPNTGSVMTSDDTVLKPPAAPDPAMVTQSGAARDEAKEEDKPSDGAEDRKKSGVKALLPNGATAEIDGEFHREDAKPDKTGKLDESTPTRSWFPETFLFEPLVVTDDNGNATTLVKVPDRLTTWRVLALAHSRSGSQGGATTSFLGTLPTYVDVVVPPFLIVGDEIRLPIQVINTTSAAVTSELVLEAKNATLSSSGGKRTVPAEGSLVEYVTLKADRAGTIALKAGLVGTDAVVHTIDVKPSGKPLVTTRSGTLAAPRSLSIEGPADSDPTTDRVRLLVFPGALALLRTELGVSTSRAGVADDAYALLLAGRAPSLLASLGDTADPVALRELSIVTGQRAIRHARTLDVTTATLLTEAALAHPNNPVLVRLGERAAAYLAQNQRPDGTFSGATGWTLQRVLMATADATRAVAASPENRHRTQAVRAKAAGAFERSHGVVDDAYTAAAMLASGAIKPGPLADTLRERVKQGITAATDGAKFLAVAQGIVRADGSTPTTAEATALAVLALQGDANAPLADLGATLLGSYSPTYGWGDGRANLLCMHAVLELFKAPVPADVKITLTMDGKPIAEGTLDRAKLKEVLSLEAAAPGLAGTHTWAITAEPPVAGLGFSLALNSWVPWPKQTVQQGLELALPAQITGVAGKAVDIAITAIAPSGLPLHVQHVLPAGVQVDTPSLEALVTAGTVTRVSTADGKIDLYANALEPGQTFSAQYRVVPTLAGKLKSAASMIEAGDHRFYVPPTEWVIR